ncbi:hypothetical protein [Vibrio rhizosphaerae]|uniref:hypothetical protein n=1 Tax=Vibrio rhizosphaerae TaxID=398736 RepID=UPI00056EDD27|nr:hypothetical protein [Vibrio rhizosphaerae]
MDVIDAYWEQRNLNLKTYELIFNDADNIELYDVWFDSVKSHADYIVSKVPVGHPQLCNDLLSNGFSFIEMITVVSVNQLPTLSNIQQRIMKKISYTEMTDEDVEVLYSEIRKGLFKTDRIAMESGLGIEKSIRRYIGWLSDEKARGARFYRINFNDEYAGFFVLGTMKNNKMSSILAGIFESYQKYAIGFFMNYLAYQEAFSQGAKAVKTSFSSNNRGASSIHYSIACNLHEQYYVLSKMV